MSVDTLYEAVFAHGGPWTEDEYFALPETPARIELVDGMLVVSPLSSVPHHRLVYELTHLLRTTCPDGRWEALPGGNVRLWQDHIRIPDVVVARSGLDVLYVDADDVLLLAEVTSPGNFRQDRIVKHTDYAEAGIAFYLRVDLHDGVGEVRASAFELVDGSYREYATAPDGVLRLERPWPLEADLRALARGH
ncbi:Uma2 family endonuclease [Pseudonocardia aurantiaca]|uniref:Uma2 family endonuclease n=1 Tax=Pseudonocardia aurantiaca TaxID=75290 RepID=A0ABW4FFK4_9PSEU